MRDLTAGARGQAAWSVAGGMTVAAGAAILLVLVNQAVGFLGSEDNPANVVFLAVIATAIVGMVVARGRPGGMAKAMMATAIAQVVVGVVALAAGLGSSGWKGFYEVVLGTTGFGVLWLFAAWLFRRAARSAETRHL